MIGRRAGRATTFGVTAGLSDTEGCAGVMGADFAKVLAAGDAV